MRLPTMILKLGALVLGLLLTGCSQASPPSRSADAASSSPAPTSSVGIPSPSSPAAPSPSASVRVPSGPIVVDHIVDRAGVPAALYDKYWIAQGQAGQLGTTARLLLPSEQILGADAGLVASYAFTEDAEGSEVPVVGPNGVTIVVRNIRTGTTVRSFETPVAPRDGLLVGDRLFWFGEADSVLAPKRSDVAVWGLDLSDPGSTPILIAPAEPGNASSPLRLSDGGRVVMRNLGGLSEPTLVTQVIDVSRMSLRTIKSRLIYALGNGRALVKRDDGHLIVMDLDTGAPIGRALATEEDYKTFASRGEVFVQYGHPNPEPGVYIKAIDFGTGHVRDILFQGRGVVTSFLSPELSTPEVLVLFDERDDWEYDPAGFAYGTFALLDPVTGEVQPDAFTITPPD